MKTFTQTIITYAIWAFIFAGATYAYAVGTWEEPACDTPAECNAETPLNVSGTAQTKTGLLTTGGLLSSGGGYFATHIGVGVSTSTNPATLGLAGVFGGKVGARAYCDTNGSNCSVRAVDYSVGTAKYKFYTAASGYAGYDIDAGSHPANMAYGSTGTSIPGPYGMPISPAAVKTAAGITGNIKSLIIEVGPFVWAGPTPAEAENGDYFSQITPGSRRGQTSGSINRPAAVSNQTAYFSYLRSTYINNVAGITNSLINKHVTRVDLNNQNDFYLEMRLVTTTAQTYNSYWEAPIKVVGYILE